MGEQVQHEGLQLMFTHNVYFYGLKLKKKKNQKKPPKNKPGEFINFSIAQ